MKCPRSAAKDDEIGVQETDVGRIGREASCRRGTFQTTASEFDAYSPAGDHLREEGINAISLDGVALLKDGLIQGLNT